MHLQRKGHLIGEEINGSVGGWQSIGRSTLQETMRWLHLLCGHMHSTWFTKKKKVRFSNITGTTLLSMYSLKMMHKISVSKINSRKGCWYASHIILFIQHAATLPFSCKLHICVEHVLELKFPKCYDTKGLKLVQHNTWVSTWRVKFCNVTVASINMLLMKQICHEWVLRQYISSRRSITLLYSFHIRPKHRNPLYMNHMSL